jgi:prepilin-type N-terminal cleavage/methylation domain-containing protein
MVNLVRQKNTKRGFTLIELLVVISIVSLMSSIIMAPVNAARQRTRDISRLDTMREIRTALEQYKSDAGNYPATTPGYGWTCFDCTSTDYLGTSATPDLVSTDSVTLTASPLNTVLIPKYLPSIPRDPKAGTSFGNLGYLYHSDGINYCIMSFGRPENMNNFPSNVINVNRCTLPITSSGGCTSGTNSIFYSSSGFSTASGNGGTIGC